MRSIFQSVAKAVALFFVMASFGSKAIAQDAITLHIGDKAPALKYGKWIKGSPVKSMKGDQLYILEFWATWCGPCKAAMPHLTKTQKEYGDKISIIGVGVWERRKEGEPYESTLPMVEKYVKGNSDNMGYSVIADNNEEHMGNNWLKAAGQRGIPSTFIIKDEKIIWIGHPSNLDSMLKPILAGTYNMQEYKLAFEKRTLRSLKNTEGMTAAADRIDAALKAKDYKKAFEVMEQVKAEYPVMTISLNAQKFQILLQHVSEQEAIAFGTEWGKGFKNAPMYILGAVAQENSLSKSTYLWAVKNFEANNKSMPPSMYHLVASVYAKAGDYNSAVLNEEKAIEAAKTALKEGKMVGSVMDYTVTEYEETLAGYKKALQAVKN